MNLVVVIVVEVPPEVEHAVVILAVIRVNMMEVVMDHLAEDCLNEDIHVKTQMSMMPADRILLDPNHGH